jgi:shikimate kinase
MNHVILIGFMGCGKSSVGKMLARELSVPFVDTDAWIEEQNGRKISDIFRESGEEYFRELETRALEQLLEDEGRKVIAVGGGLPMRPVNREYLKKLGTTVYLLAQPETLVARLQGDDTRPLLQGGELRQKILQLMSDREDIYQSAADIRISTDGKKICEITEEIRRYVG